MLLRFYSYFYPPCIGGGEVILQHQAEELARRGHTVHVHTTTYTNIQCTEAGPPSNTTENGVHVHRHRSILIPFRNPMEKDALTPAFFMDVTAPADLQICVGYPSIHLDLLARRHRGGTPLVVQNYITAEFLREILQGKGGLNKKIRASYWRGHVRKVLAEANLVIADSPGAASALEQELGLRNVRTHIGMAVEPAEFAFPENGTEARNRLGIGETAYILAPSRISRQKGADWLVKAAGPLLGPSLKLVICGPVNEPDFLEQVRELATPWAEHVIIGQLPRPLFVGLIQQAAVLCLPSRGETVGGVVFEGMYAGVPTVVSTGVEAAREDYLHPGENGWLVEVEDVEGLRRALQEALRADPAILAAARQMVETRFTWKSSVDRYEKLLQEACGA